MKETALVHLLKNLLEQSQLREKASAERIKTLEEQVVGLSEQLKSMSKALEKNSATVEKLANELRVLRPKKCEKIMSPDNQSSMEPPAVNDRTGDEPSTEDSGEDHSPPPNRWSKAKERGNNGAKRKEYFCSEVQEHDIWPEQEGFIKELAKVIRTVDQIRYEYIPPRFIKHIYHLKICKMLDTVMGGKSPLAPFLNSNFDSSFIAGILQLRYVYFLPIERIVRLFAECGFDINKATAHSLLAKTYTLIEDMDQAAQAAVLEDTYINMDESYSIALEVGPRATDSTRSSKVYIWCAQARHLKLIHFFYDKGSRGTKVLTDYVPPNYKGAIQSDGLVNYKTLQTEQYPHTLHLTCWQHCKRDFLEIKENLDAAKIVRTINKLYQQERKIKNEWTPEKKLEQRQKYAPAIFAQIEGLLNTVLGKKTTLPKSALAKACNKTLNQFDTLCNYIKGADYDLDNNAIYPNFIIIQTFRTSSFKTVA